MPTPRENRLRATTLQPPARDAQGDRQGGYFLGGFDTGGNRWWDAHQRDENHLVGNLEDGEREVVTETGPVVFGLVRGEAARELAGSVLEPLYPALAATMRRLIYRVGADVTDSVARRPCLVVAPHPDDESLAAAATIMRKIDAGTPVRVLIATDGSKSPPRDPAEVTALRTQELHAACNELGLSVEDVEQLPFVDAELDKDGESLVAAIAQAVARFGPADVLCTSETDPHEDHAALAAATRRALAGTGVRLLAYPIWQWDRPPRLIRMLRRSGRPELVRTDGYLPRKQRAIAIYRSQMAPIVGAEGLLPSFLRHFEGPYEMFFPVPLD